MNLVFLIDNMKFSGGRKLFLEYADSLRNAGHCVHILAREKRGEFSDFPAVSYPGKFNASTIPDCDLIVTTTHREVADAVASGKAAVVHFCQGFEITDLEQRLSGDVVPPRYQQKGIMNKIRLFRKKFSWRKKMQYYNRIYGLPTHLVTISRHLQQELKKRYNRPVKLCTNGVHQKFFYPAAEWQAPEISRERPLKIVNVGPYEVTFKGIPTTLKAVELLKSKGIPVHFSRITPNVTETDKTHPAVDQLYTNLTQEEMGGIFRESDIYISNSTEGEGFGLPAMEAISCGLICVLSSIPSYLGFHDSTDFAFFVPQNDVWATVNAVEEIIGSTPEILERMRNKALKISTYYSHDAACRRFENILSGIIDKREDDGSGEGG